MRGLLQRFLLLLTAGICYAGGANAQLSYVDKMLSHKVTVHYPDHTVIAQVKPVEQVALASDTRYYWFSGNQINITQGGYSGKLLNGAYQDFYLNKNLKEAGDFEKGLKTGVWKCWSPAGLLTEEASFSHGRKNGTFLKYDSLGRVMEKSHFHQDLLNGKQELMLADSTRIIYYKNGKVVQPKQIVPQFIQKLLPKKHKK